MQELYDLIEEKIKESGYPGHVDGEEFYDSICDEITDKENGTYLLMIKGEGDVRFECRIVIMDEEFDLPCADIYAGDKVYHVDFDK